MPTPVICQYGPFQPLGLITVATAGTTVALTVNIGLAFTGAGSSEYGMSFHALYFTTPSTNTGNIYLVLPGQTAANTDAIILAIPPSTTFTMTAAAQVRNFLSLECMVIDTDTGGNKVQVTGMIV